MLDREPCLPVLRSQAQRVQCLVLEAGRKRSATPQRIGGEPVVAQQSCREEEVGVTQRGVESPARALGFGTEVITFSPVESRRGERDPDGRVRQEAQSDPIVQPSAVAVALSFETVKSPLAPARAHEESEVDQAGVSQIAGDVQSKALLERRDRGSMRDRGIAPRAVESEPHFAARPPYRHELAPPGRRYRKNQSDYDDENSRRQSHSPPLAVLTLRQMTAVTLQRPKSDLPVVAAPAALTLLQVLHLHDRGSGSRLEEIRMTSAAAVADTMDPV